VLGDEKLGDEKKYYEICELCERAVYSYELHYEGDHEGYRMRNAEDIEPWITVKDLEAPETTFHSLKICKKCADEDPKFEKLKKKKRLAWYQSRIETTEMLLRRANQIIEKEKENVQKLIKQSSNLALCMSWVEKDESVEKKMLQTYSLSKTVTFD